MTTLDVLDRWLDDPEFQKSYAAYKRRLDRAEKLTGWMRRLPLGEVAFAFWYGLLTEGIRSTVIPRWGAMTFAFLNDGDRPTLWHTWQQMTCTDHGDTYDEITGRSTRSCYCGIYPGGAPRNRAAALRAETPE